MIFDLLLIGLAIALEPLPITALILILASERGVRKGLGFVLGWFASLTAVIAMTVLVTGGKPPAPSSAPSIGVLVVKLLLGVALVVVGLRRRKRLGQPSPPKKPPTWMSRIDNMGVISAAGLAILLQPWGLIAAGAATVVDAKLSNLEEYLVLFAFVLVSSSVVLTMEIYAAFWPEAATKKLSDLRTWMDTHRDQVIVALALIVGLWLVSKSLYGLVTS